MNKLTIFKTLLLKFYLNLKISVFISTSTSINKKALKIDFRKQILSKTGAILIQNKPRYKYLEK
ncbi:hypothetical protein CQ046_22615 [Chryseobacterium sp. MYb7]|nr:hypothetical protein CQ046_22615 [Chryseobacterium sp. MYb7]